MKVKWAIKLVASVSMILTLMSAYYLGRRYNFETIPQMIWLTWVWLVMRLSPAAWGGNIGGAIDLGLVTNMFAMPFFFFYIALAPNLFLKGKYITPTFLLTLTILTHVYSGLAAIICFIGFMIAYARTKKHLLYP